METMNEFLQKIDETQKQINEQRPLDRESVLSLKEYYKIGLTWSSNALEGNTLTESETKVFISGSHYPLPVPDKVPQMMKEMIKRISSRRADEHPVIAAARTHLDFVFIHPFADGNGRVARLIIYFDGGRYVQRI